VLHQLAEIDALIGGEVERDPVAPERHLDLGQLHLEIAQLDPLAAMLESLGLEGEVPVLLVEVFLLDLADDLARDAGGALERAGRGIAEDQGGERLAVLALHHDPVAQAQPQVAGVEEELAAAAAQGDLNDLRHDRTSMADGGVRFTLPEARQPGTCNRSEGGPSGEGGEGGRWPRPWRD